MLEASAIIDRKLNELAELPRGSASGRRLELAGASESEHHALLRVTLHDIASRISPDVLDMLPAPALEQLTIMSIVKNHDTAGLLKSLINSFVLAYITPETHDDAFGCLESLEALRADIAASRSHTGDDTKGGE